jgi:ERCC4-related helicase
MSKITNIKEFNNILETFLGQLSPLVGTTYHHYFKKLIKVNSTMPIQEFSKNALPYKNQIMAEDETYFANTSNHDDKINGDLNTLNEILRLKDIYERLDADSRKEVWSYFQALTILSEEYLKLTH